MIVYIVFGVSGSGKTTIGKELANELGVPFYDADDFHPEGNIKKMAQGIPLTDKDRMPWLQTLAKEIKKWHQHKGAVLACSALKVSYREQLQSIDQRYLKWIFLEGDYELISKRLKDRKNHFFDPGLLASQFETLELPENGRTLCIAIDQPVAAMVSKIQNALKTTKSQLGIIGLGVMGNSIARNFLSKGFSLSVYNRHVAGKEEDVAHKFAEERSGELQVSGFDTLAPFVASITQPRTILLMVNAGKAVGHMIDALVPMLSPGDCIVDGGNSHYEDTKERATKLEKAGIHFIGAGISGGEEGALKGPSIMPGGSKEAYVLSGKFLEAIAARDQLGNPCCQYIGPAGSGHFVKMVHNGMEYAEMQLLAEIYHLLRFYADTTPHQISEIFDSWRKNGKDGFLIEITARILQKKEGNAYLIDKILDMAGQKGTGGWSTKAAMDMGLPLSTISEAVMARNLSSLKPERVAAAKAYQINKEQLAYEKDELLEVLENAYYISSVINHAIGFRLMYEASVEYNWKLDLSEIARIWTNGCIVRSQLMEKISGLFSENDTTSLLLVPEIVEIIRSGLGDLQKAVSASIKVGCAMPVSSAALQHVLAYTSEQSSANMIQAQRDFFGAHTYQRTDQPIDAYFHTNWKEE